MKLFPHTAMHFESSAADFALNASANANVWHPKKDILIKKLNSQTDSNFHVDIKRNSSVRLLIKLPEKSANFRQPKRCIFNIWTEQIVKIELTGEKTSVLRKKKLFAGRRNRHEKNSSTKIIWRHNKTVNKLLLWLERRQRQKCSANASCLKMLKLAI